LKSGTAAAAPAVGVVVVNWNDAERSRRCLLSLRDLDYPNYRVCLVDNGSTDRGVDSIKAEFPEVEMLILPSNRGYAGGCNAGISWARGADLSYVWLLNNDTVVDSESLQALVTRGEDLRRLGQQTILAPKILTSEEPHRVWSAGGFIRWPWLKGEHIGIGEEGERHDTPREIEWASGCALFFPVRVVDLIGPLDERYFLYLEDVDWSLRARRHGVSIWYVPNARLWHDVSRSVGTLDPRIVRYYSYRNYYVLGFAHSGLLGRAWFSLHLAITFLKIGLRVLLFSSYRKDSYYHARTRALVDFVKRRFGQAPFVDKPAAMIESGLERESVT
jgi:GT2 family glycosyltransferase